MHGQECYFAVAGAGEKQRELSCMLRETLHTVTVTIQTANERSSKDALHFDSVGRASVFSCRLERMKIGIVVALHRHDVLFRFTNIVRRISAQHLYLHRI